jgi:hypothetical protein
MENLVILIEYPRTNRLTALHGHFSGFIYEVLVISIVYVVFHGFFHCFPLLIDVSIKLSTKQTISICKLNKINH